MIELHLVREYDYDFLYNLLLERDGDKTINISNIVTPTFENHVKFVDSKPYFAWYIIYENDIRVGSIYLNHDDSFGYFILKKFQNRGIGQKAFELLTKYQDRKSVV